MSRNPNVSPAFVLGVVVFIVTIGVVGITEVVKSFREDVKEITSVEESRGREWADPGNPFEMKTRYFLELGVKDLSAKYDVVCIHGMPYLQERSIRGTLMPFATTKSDLARYAYDACKIREKKPLTSLESRLHSGGKQ